VPKLKLKNMFEKKNTLSDSPNKKLDTSTKLPLPKTSTVLSDEGMVSYQVKHAKSFNKAISLPQQQ
jgi:hypothetical protein